MVYDAGNVERCMEHIMFAGASTTRMVSAGAQFTAHLTLCRSPCRCCCVFVSMKICFISTINADVRRRRAASIEIAFCTTWPSVEGAFMRTVTGGGSARHLRNLVRGVYMGPFQGTTDSVAGLADKGGPRKTQGGEGDEMDWRERVEGRERRGEGEGREGKVRRKGGTPWFSEREYAMPSVRWADQMCPRSPDGGFTHRRTDGRTVCFASAVATLMAGRCVGRQTWRR